MTDSPNLKTAKPAGKRPFRDRLREFFKAIGRSCYDMEFYRQVRVRSWKRGLAYMLRLMVLMTLAMAIFFGPAIYSGFGQLHDYLDIKIPDGASVTLASGQLSAALPMPTDFGGEEDRFIVDTSVVGLDVPRERLGENGVLIGRDAIFFRTEGKEDQAYALKDFPGFSVNKRQVLSWLDQYARMAAVIITLVLAVFYFLAVSVGNTFFVLFGTALAYFFGKLLKVGLGYSQWLASSFHAITLPLFLGAVFNAFGWTRIPVFPVVFFMILASVMADERARGTGQSLSASDSVIPDTQAALSQPKEPKKKGSDKQSKKKQDKK